MLVKAIKTHKISTKDLLIDILDRYLAELQNGDVVVITSKILSIMQGRVLRKEGVDKYRLIRQEADAVLESDHNPYGFHLTIKEGILIPSAGIDESNADDCYILYPENIMQSAAEIWQHVRSKWGLSQLGVVITDSHTTIMRRGVTGIALGWCGFEPLYSYIDKPDIFGRAMRVTQINILDSLATAAVFVMGEGAEQTPLAVIQNAPKIHFQTHIPTEEEIAGVKLSLEDDLYYPLLRNAKWR